MSDARWNDPRDDDVRDRGDEWRHVYDPRDRDDDPRDAKSLGISLRSATEPIDDTSTGKLMEGMLAAFAQFETT